MHELTKEALPNKKLSRIFIANFIGGIGWSLGLTLGFALVGLFLSRILTALGGLPLIGQWFADLIITTQTALPH